MRGVRGVRGVGDGSGREGGGWLETAGGLEQCCAVEVAVGEGEDESASDRGLNFITEDLQGLWKLGYLEGGGIHVLYNNACRYTYAHEHAGKLCVSIKSVGGGQSW